MAQITGSYDSMRRQLRPMRRRLRVGDTLLFASRSLWMATVASLLIAGIGHLRPIPNLRLWTLLPLAIWLVAVIGYMVFRPLPLRRVAQRVDSALGLREGLLRRLNCTSSIAIIR